jgi:predicted glycosyltransferase involved in capsule biosynthesis
MYDDVYFAIPWRTSLDTYRNNNLDYVLHRLRKITDSKVYLVDSTRDPFSLAASRNACVKNAIKKRKRIVAICDADSIVEEESLRLAIQLARDNERVVFPFTNYLMMSKDFSSKVLDGHPLVDVEFDHNLDNSVGGMCVSSVKAWDALGGQDERFYGWGFEDTAFRTYADRLNKSFLRTGGNIYHLWHPVIWRQTDESYIHNKNLADRYESVPNVDVLFKEFGQRFI